jgi:5'-nucleotidase
VTAPILLISNDDGFQAAGIQTLATALESCGEVWVVAPDRESSAVSHALTLSRPLRMTELAPRRFTVDGTPTDCVTLAFGQALRATPPTLVISGINFGPNMGDDVHYSGTVSAAIEAAIMGVPAIAVSQVVGPGFTFAHAARFARRVVEQVLSGRLPLPAGTLLNVNVPLAAPKGVRFTRLGNREYTESVVEDVDPRGRPCYWIGGGDPIWDDIPGTDFAAVGAGYISITPLQLDMTDHARLAQLQATAGAWGLEEPS